MSTTSRSLEVDAVTLPENVLLTEDSRTNADSYNTSSLPIASFTSVWDGVRNANWVARREAAAVQFVTISKEGLKMRKLAKYLVVGIVAVTSAMAPGLRSAHAAGSSLWTLSDTMETNQSTNWAFEKPYPDQSGGHFEDEDDNKQARSGTHNGYMYMNGSKAAWISLDRRANLSIVYPGAPQATCAAQVYVKGNKAHGQLEVIDTKNWTYVSVKKFDVDSSSYVKVATAEWIPARADITVRLVLASTSNGVYHNVRVDDLTIACLH